MSDHAVTLFELRNAPNLVFDYRLVDLDGVLRATQGDDDQIDRNLNLLAKIVAIKAQTAVAIVRRGGKPYLAIPADKDFNEQEVTIPCLRRSSRKS
jgi:ActR/RegA family two-component response regulator